MSTSDLKIDYLLRALRMIAEGEHDNARWMQQVAARALYSRPLPYGTCVDCPEDGDGVKQPHKCIYMGRIDHMLE